MTKDRQLKLQALSSMLPYGVYCYIASDAQEVPRKLIGITVEDEENVLLDFEREDDGLAKQVYLGEVIPILRPMSSLTKEETDELTLSMDLDYATAYGEQALVASRIVNFFSKKHVDYLGLIDIGAAKAKTA